MLIILIWSLHTIYLEIIAVLHKYVHLLKKKKFLVQWRRQVSHKLSPSCEVL